MTPATQATQESHSLIPLHTTINSSNFNRTSSSGNTNEERQTGFLSAYDLDPNKSFKFGNILSLSIEIEIKDT